MKICISTYLLLFLIPFINAQTDFETKLVDAAISITKDNVIYDPNYYSIPYPNGDVPPNKGVCTDVIIRSYRKLGIDLQKEVHEDMVSNFKLYPQNWGLKSTDSNIDHRRVPNLMCFFTRKGQTKSITDKKSYSPSDIVCWDLGGGITHIGIVTNLKTSDGNRFLIVHNIGSGQIIQDCIYDYKIIGHYSYQK